MSTTTTTLLAEPAAFVAAAQDATNERDLDTIMAVYAPTRCSSR